MLALHPAFSKASHLGGGGGLGGGGLGGGGLQAAGIQLLQLIITAGSSESWQVRRKLVTSVCEAFMIRLNPVLAGSLATAHTWEVADLEAAADCRQQPIMGQCTTFWEQSIR